MKRFHQFLVIYSWFKLVLDYSLSCTWEYCYLGGLSRQGMADSLEFCGSGCSVLVLCKPMLKQYIYIYIYILWSKFWRGNIYSSVLILGTSFSSVK